MGKNYICALLCGAMIISQAMPLYAESIISEEIAACEDEGAWAAETECENESAQAAEAGFLLTVNGAQESCSDIVDAICSVSSNDVSEIKLTQDVTINCDREIVQSAGSLTIDLNGHELLVEAAKETKCGYNSFGYIVASGKNTALVVKDSSSEKAGKLKSSIKYTGTDSENDNHALVTIYNHATFSLLSGTIEADTAILGKDSDEISVSGNIEAVHSGIKGGASKIKIQDAKIRVVCTEKPLSFIPTTVYCYGSNVTVKNSVIEYVGKDISGLGLAFRGGSRDIDIEDSIFKCETDDKSHSTCMEFGTPQNLTMNNVKVTNESRYSQIGCEGVIVKIGENTTLSANNIDVDIKSNASGEGWRIDAWSGRNFEESNASINNLKVNVSAVDSADGIQGLGHYTNCESNVSSTKCWAHAYTSFYATEAEGKTSFENTKFRAVVTKTKNLKNQDNAYGIYAEERFPVVLKNNCSVYVKGGYRTSAVYEDRDFKGKITLAEGCHWVNSKNKAITNPSKVSYALVTDGSVTPADSPAPISISKKCSFIWDDTRTAKAPRLYYDGTIKEPAVLVKNKADKSQLTEGVDYTVTYAPKNSRSTITTDQAGAFKVVIEGKGNYTGKITKYYSVKRLSLTNAYNDGAGILSFSIKNADEIEYDPSGAKPEISVSVNGIPVTGDEFNKCFKVSYARNKVVRDASHRKPPVIILQGRGNFSGKLMIPFTIKPRSTEE